jgi:lipoprotein-anchoring transpeptidase ErfK/SrfK
MRKKSLRIAFAAAALCVGATAKAEVVIDVDVSTQTMHVESAAGSHDWPVSTARAGFSTPRGHFAPTAMERMHYSKKYHNSPMPHSIFFDGGYAIHGTHDLAALGTPASHGCVRLSPANAKTLYELVKSEGASISIGESSARYASR